MIEMEKKSVKAISLQKGPSLQVVSNLASMRIPHKLLRGRVVGLGPRRAGCDKSGREKLKNLVENLRKNLRYNDLIEDTVINRDMIRGLQPMLLTPSEIKACDNNCEDDDPC